MKLLGQLLGLIIEIAWVTVAVVTPLLGVWLASSLIAFHGGPRELALLGGVLLFPVLPVLWEIRATRKWKAAIAARRQLVGTPKRKLDVVYRLVFRTLALNVLFIAVLAIWFPKVAFTALATRGDWFVGEGDGDGSRIARKVAFSAAAGLEWLHELANPNPYDVKDGEQPVPSDVTPTKEEPK